MFKKGRKEEGIQMAGPEEHGKNGALQVGDPLQRSLCSSTRMVLQFTNTKRCQDSNSLLN